MDVSIYSLVTSHGTKELYWKKCREMAVSDVPFSLNLVTIFDI